MPVDTIQFFGTLEYPSHAANCQTVNIELFVSQGHVTSISIAIPISIAIILPNAEVVAPATGSASPIQGKGPL